MFELADVHGNSVLMKNGKPFRYSTRDLAKSGKQYLDVRDDTFYRIREVQS